MNLSKIRKKTQNRVINATQYYICALNSHQLPGIAEASEYMKVMLDETEIQNNCQNCIY